MEKPKVAILGIGRIGEFHAREFYNAGCDVVAILTKSKESSEEKADNLKKVYGIKARPYSNLDELLFENIDAVSICTPPELHHLQIKKCPERNLHVLSEKPFILNPIAKSYSEAKDLMDLARKKNLILTVNMQWISLLESVPPKFVRNLDKFSIYLDSTSGNAVQLIGDVVPHMNSFLIRLLGENKELKNIQFPILKDDKIEINFDYGICPVKYNIGVKNSRPRKLSFSLNNVNFEKMVEGEGQRYKMYLSYGEKKIPVLDPLTISINKFIYAITKRDKPLVAPEEILQNIKIRDQILEAYRFKRNKI